jgi:integrase
MTVNIWWYESRSQWCADVPTNEGRKRLYLGENEQKAQAGLHRYMANYYDGLDNAQYDPATANHSSKDGILLVELGVNFINWNKTNRTKKTWQSYRDGLKYVMRRYQEKFAVELTPTDIENVKIEMVESGYAAATINKMVGAVKRLYSWAKNQALVDRNPVAKVESVSKHVNAPAREEDKHLQLEKALKYINLCRKSPPLGDICKMLLLTGMRVGEIVRVTWADVDFGEKMIRLTQHKTSGRTECPRNIPLAEEAIEILKRQRRDGVDLSQPVFLGANNQQFTVSALHCRLRRLRKKHEELEGFSFHKLRHTCATYLARIGVQERVAQEILGHSSKLMTRYYTATGKDEMLNAAEKLSKAAMEEEE